MAKKIKQIRYYGDNDPRNYPSSNLGKNIIPTYRNLISGSAFKYYMPIIRLGIQTIPETKFYLNNSNDSIIVGHNGIYELDLQNLTEIHSLRFDPSSLTAIKQQDSVLIIDIIYEDGDDV